LKRESLVMRAMIPHFGRLDSITSRLVASACGVEQSGSSSGSIRRISMSTKLKGDGRCS